MTSSVGVLDTGVVSSRALLPEPHAYWNYSSLKEIEECPRRYALARASYPGLWKGPGYPPMPTVPALFGNVVHGALEVVVKAFAAAGVESPQAIEATEVLRKLGGLTAVVEDVVTTQLAPLDSNPRLDQDRRRRIARELRAQTSDARVQVQTYLSRSVFVPGVSARRCARVDTIAGQSQPRVRQPLGQGSHTEVSLIADNLRLLGRIDLVTIASEKVDIVDYKTGIEVASHREQLRLYALLWDADRQVNPERRTVSSLTAAYRDHDVNVNVPMEEDLQELASSISAKIKRADAELVSGAPTPRPSLSNCKRCAVRQLCDGYWKQVPPKPSEIRAGEWFDFEGTVGQQNGQRSWWMADPDTGQAELLLRVMSATPLFASGDRVRILGLRGETDPDIDAPLALLTASSEVFHVEAPS